MFAGVRDTKWESKLLSSVPVESVAEQLKPLLAQGWRPIAIAIDSNVLLTLRREDDAGTAITTERDEYNRTCSLVLHRPVIPPGNYELSSLGNEPGRNAIETRHTVQIFRPFALP